MAAAAIKQIIRMLERILIKRAKTVTTAQGGNVLAEKSQSKKMQGKVVAVGAGARNIQTGEDIHAAVNAGVRVLLPEFGGTEVEMEGKKENLLFRESQILA